jgi:hypothetical protein
MNQDLAKISSSHHHPAHPLTRRVYRPRGLPSPTCQPQGCALPLSPLPRSGPRLDRPPRSPPLLSTLPTKLPHASLSLIFAESPGKPTTSPLHHCHQSTPNPCWPRRSGHAPVLHPTHISGRIRPCIRAHHCPTTPLAQPLSLSRPLSRLGRRRTPAHADVTERSA